MTTNTRENILARLVGHGGIEAHNSVQQQRLTPEQVTERIDRPKNAIPS